MLEKIREGSQGVGAKIILGAIIVTFALTGVGSYINSTPVPPVAVVNDEEITQQAFDQKYSSNRARMEQQFGQMFQTLAADESYMKNFQDGVLDQLVAETLQTQMAEKFGMYGDLPPNFPHIQSTPPDFEASGRKNFFHIISAKFMFLRSW